MREADRRRAVVAGSVLVALVLQAASLTHPLLGDVTPEEGMVPAAAVVMSYNGITWAPWLVPQTFCGGCVVESVAARGLFAVLGESVAVWKLIPTAFVALGVGAGTHLAARHSALAGVLAAMFYAVAPRSLVEGGLRAFGNHMEAGALALLGLALLELHGKPARWRGVGAAWGTALAFTLGAAPVVAGMLISLVPMRPDPRSKLWPLAQGLAVAPAAWAVQYALTATTPFEVVDRVAFSDASLARLFTWDQVELWLGPHRFGETRGAAAAALGLLGALALGGSAPGRPRQAAWAFAMGFVVFVLTGVGIGPAVDHPNAGDHARYLHPLLWLVPALGGLAVGDAWTRGRRLPALTVALLLVFPGLLGRVDLLSQAGQTAHLAQPAPQWRWFHTKNRPARGARALPWPCADAPRCLDLAALDTARHRLESGETFSDVLPDAPDGRAIPWAVGLGLGAAVSARADAPSPDALQVRVASQYSPRAGRAARAYAALRKPSYDPAPPPALAAWGQAQLMGEEGHGGWRVPKGPKGVRRSWAHGVGVARWLRGGHTLPPQHPRWPDAHTDDHARGVDEARARPWLPLPP